MSEPIVDVKPVRVLLVEDSPSDQFLIREYLNHAEVSFEVTRAKSLASALRKLAADRFDCVVLDLNLPDGEGLEVIRAVTGAAHEAAVVVMTGHADDDMAMRALRLGAQDFLVKDDPSLHALARTIRFAVQRKRIQQRLETSERLLALAVRATHDAIWEWDVQRDSLYRAPAWFRLLGLTPTPFLAGIDDWMERIHPDDRAALRARLEAGDGDGDGDEVCAASFRMLDADGVYQRMYARWSVEKHRGALARCVGCLIDVERSWRPG